MSKKNILIHRMAESFFALRQKCALKDLFIANSLDISLSEFNCLVQFFETDSLGIKNLAEGLGLSPAGVTRIVTSLEEKNLVERKISPDDRRSIDVFLTDSGKALVKRIKKFSLDRHAEILSHIKPQYREQVVDSIEKLTQAIDLWMSERKNASEY